MSRKYSTIQLRLYLLGTVVLLAGLICSAWIYLSDNGDIASGNILGYEIIDGHAYPINANDSKRYQYDMERIGGKFAVVSTEINQWFSGLLHGKGLAYTIAILAIGFALACYWIAQHPDYKVPESDKDSGIG
jgi:hypothetical protein